MQGLEFRKWAETSYKSYGTDPWFFIRELAQNSRDATSKYIQVKADYTTDGSEILIFEDDGTGMDYQHAVKYLFRLYSSSKTNDNLAAGMYGAGFWTILRYNPRKIIIESKTRLQEWAVLLDDTLSIKEYPNNLKKSGTRITLIRDARFKNEADFFNTIKKSLLKYCRFLRKNNRKADRLPVLFRGKNITQPLRVKGPVSIVFKKGQVEGSVGLGKLPEVTLYARGLPVWEGTILEELSHTYSPTTNNYEIGYGLSPVFILNGNNLDVNISRNCVIDNRALKRVREVAKQQLSKFIQLYTDSAFPRNFFRRGIDSLKRTGQYLTRSFWRTLLLILVFILPAELIILNKLFTPENQGKNIQSVLKIDKNLYSGPTVTNNRNKIQVNMSYQPPINTWFKLFAADQYNIKKGFVRDPNQIRVIPPSREGNPNDLISVKIGIPESGKILLPQPVNYRIDSKTVRVNHSFFSPITLNANGEVSLNIPEKGSLIQYDCFPFTPNSGLDQKEISRLVRLPDEIKIPESIDRQLKKFSTLDVPKRINRALSLTGQLLKYDTSKQTATKYNTASKATDWFSRVLEIKGGDCDILNGVNIVFLRRMNVPSRLIIGFIGKNGHILPGLHAWTEYHDNGWQIIDASTVTRPAIESSGVSSLSQPESTHGVTDSHPEKTMDFNVIYFIPIIILFVILVLSVIRFIKKRLKKQIIQNTEIDLIKENIAQMAIGATLHPDVWGHNSNIWHYRIVPTIGGKHISIKQALTLSKKGKLYIGYKHNPIVRRLVRSGTPVLDPANQTFGSLIRILPGKIDLDLIHAMKATQPESLKNNPVAQLLQHVNRILNKILKVSDLCMLAPGLKKQDYIDVNTPFQKKYIAINPEGGKITKLAQLYQKNSPLAVCRAIKTIFHESRMFQVSSDVIINKASILLLKEIQ